MLTLNDYFKQSTDPMQKGLLADMLRFSDLMKIVPIDSVSALRVSATRWQTLPTVGFRKYGGGYTESTGTTEPFTETLALLGGDIKFDRLANIGSFIEDPIVTQMNMKAKAMALSFNWHLINGDHAVDPDSFEGLKKRVAGMPARQTIYLDSNGNGTGVTLKVLASEANEQLFLDGLAKIKNRVDGASALLGNEQSYESLGQVLRRMKISTQIADYLGKTWDSYGNVPLVDVGLMGDKSTEIITNTETIGGVADSSSIYAVRFDTDDGVRVIDLAGAGGPKVYDPLNGGEMESGPQKLRRIDWPVGLFQKSQYTIARLTGFKMAAA
jgi:hypothetical protein